MESKRFQGSTLPLTERKKNRLQFSLFLTNLLEGFRITFMDRTWVLETDSPDNSVIANPERLSQVFVNIYENAYSFSQREGVIKTTVNTEKHQIKIIVFNEGPPLPEEEKIFKRFYTSREYEKNRHHGLGLSIVKTIVESYGGSVKGENSPGGVSFIIMLPLSIS